MRLGVLLTLGLFVGVEGWPHGAPASACDTLLPSHRGEAPQDSPSPYTIVTDQTTYSPGEDLTISLLAPDREPFLGFLLETRLTDGQSRLGGFVGAITPTEGTHRITGCGSATLTHADSGKASFHNLTVVWTAPLQQAGSFVIRVTFVKSFSTFWVGVTSPVITPAEPRGTVPNPSPSPQVIETKTTTTIPSVTTTTTNISTNDKTLTIAKISPANVSYTLQDNYCKNLSSEVHTDVACGRSKGCFVSCNSYNCDYVVTWVSRADQVEFEVTARVTGSGDQWVAIGFSDDIEMGDDSVVECVSERGVISVYQSFNYVYYNTRLHQPRIGLSQTQGCLHDGVFWCKFTRDKMIWQDEQIKRFDLNKPWIVMYANGEMLDGAKQMHNLSPRYGPWTSGAAVNFEEMAMAGKGSGSRLLISLHACFMIVAWVVCAGGGILAARYYRAEWPNLQPFGGKLWFMIHRTSLVVTFTLVVTAFFIVYEEADRGFGPVKNGYATGKLYEAVHPILGLVTFVLTFVNPIMAIFRPDPEADLRPLFNWVHRCVGVFTFVIALFTIGLGLGMEKAGVPQIGLYVLMGFAVYQCTVAISLEVWDCLHQKQSEKDTVEVAANNFEYQALINKPDFNSEEETRCCLSDLWSFKSILFFGNTFILLAVATFLIYLVIADFP